MASVAQISIRREGFIGYVKYTVNRQGRKLFSTLESSVNTPFKCKAATMTSILHYYM